METNHFSEAQLAALSRVYAYLLSLSERRKKGETADDDSLGENTPIRESLAERLVEVHDVE